MASFRRVVERNFGSFPHFVLYVLLEWLVIILLFTDGIIAFVCNEIARLFDLRVPCLLCTRIDHVFLRRDPHLFFNESICQAHKMEVYKGCLFSLHPEKDSDFDDYKSLEFVEDEQRKSLLKPLNKDKTDISPSRCDCCGKAKSSPKSLALNAPAPSPRTPLVVKSDLPEVVEAQHAPTVEEPKTEASALTRGSNFFDQASPRWAHQVSSKKLPVDRFDFPSDPNEDENEDGSDEDLLTRLKRQVRSDRKTLLTLSMELDEERSASAVAAKNAMAMITRLQADKAAVQMEALQYQRMMEEQAEYDQEAMQRLRDLLYKNEEDLRSLEFELEEYREKFGEIHKIESEFCEIDDDEDYRDMKLQGFSCLSEKSDGGSSTGADPSVEEKGGVSDQASFDFEKERSFLLGLLRDLEDKINSKLDERSGSPEGVVVENENENKGFLAREVSFFREKLREIEADIELLKHAATTLQRGEEGTRLLAEIAEHLRKLRQPTVQMQEACNSTDARSM